MRIYSDPAELEEGGSFRVCKLRNKQPVVTFLVRACFYSN